jgi:phosphohistidine phosphatase
LAERGREAASAIADALAERHQPAPDLVLCSTSLRTRETFELIAAAWAKPVPVEFDRGLYLVEAPALLRRLSEVDSAVIDLWLIGHNPGLHELAYHLADRATNWSSFPGLSSRFPTAARVSFSLPIETWHELPRAIPRIDEVAFPARGH